MRILVTSDLHGATGMLPALSRVVSALAPDLVTFSGDVPPYLMTAEGQTGGEEEAAWETFLYFLGELPTPVAFIPGNLDGPASALAARLLAATKCFPNLHPVHGGTLIDEEGGHAIFGFGGGITDSDRSSGLLLRLPWWEAALALLSTRTFGRRAIVLLHTPPVGVVDVEGGTHMGSRRVNELIEEFRPGFVFCGHAHNAQGSEVIAGTLVVNPGALNLGYYAVVDTESRKVDLEVLAP